MMEAPRSSFLAINFPLITLPPMPNASDIPKKSEYKGMIIFIAANPFEPT